MAGRGRIYQRGLIYYIAYRWDGREYRESARSAEFADAERLLATRLAERLGPARSGPLTFDDLAAWYLDDYGVRPAQPEHGAWSGGQSPRGVQGLARDGDHDRSGADVSARAAGGWRGGGHGEPGDLGAAPDAAAGVVHTCALPIFGWFDMVFWP